MLKGRTRSDSPPAEPKQTARAGSNGAQKPSSVPPPPSARGTTNGKTLAKREPSHDEIAQRAFELFVQRGGAHGAHVEDWLRAEAELRRR